MKRFRQMVQSAGPAKVSVRLDKQTVVDSRRHVDKPSRIFGSGSAGGAARKDIRVCPTWLSNPQSNTPPKYDKSQVAPIIILPMPLGRARGYSDPGMMTQNPRSLYFAGVRVCPHVSSDRARQLEIPRGFPWAGILLVVRDLSPRPPG